jgi:thioredoxin reductase (NADPH)
VTGKAVIIATVASYRRLEVPDLEALQGTGVFYGAAISEAQAMEGQDVYVVGGANSAGQAAMHLSKYAARVTLLVRGNSLNASMSDYLVREIEAADNIEVRFRTRVVGGGGVGRLERLVLEDSVSGLTETVPASALFVLIGARPHTEWLPERSNATKADTSSPVKTYCRMDECLKDGRSNSPPYCWNRACPVCSRPATLGIAQSNV